MTTMNAAAPSATATETSIDMVDAAEIPSLELIPLELFSFPMEPAMDDSLEESGVAETDIDSLLATVMANHSQMSQDTLGFTLVGPYDVLAGCHKDVDRNSAGRRPNFLLHWRYYYDPPELLTVVKGDDEKQFHLGYFRDVPTEMPVFVAANSANDNGTITPRGDNLFAAVSYYIAETLKDKGLSNNQKKSLQSLQESVKSAASDGGYSLELKTKGMKEREKKVVTKTFHGAGLVVPVDDNDVGYRPVPETPGDLKKMLARIRNSTTEAERDKHMEPLQEIITYVQFANDECDYGEGVELGLDLFTFGGKCFHSPVRCLLSLGYQLLGRPEYGKIVEAHMKRRPHSSELSQID
ncbi:hypothetical protein ACOMHN_018069 [Nucella lapillus]